MGVDGVEGVGLLATMLMVGFGALDLLNKAWSISRLCGSAITARLRCEFQWRHVAQERGLYALG